MSWPRRTVRCGLLLIAVAMALGAAAPRALAPPSPHPILVIVVDGLRPDYVTLAVMPRLVRLGQRGIVFTAHHSVFPTVTRVNAASFVTGAYPETHGLLGNIIYIPSVNAARGLDTGERANLEAVARAERQLLTAPTLGELLQRGGKKLLAVSSGSSGSALLLNNNDAGAIINSDFTLPPELAAQVLKTLGPVPAHATPNDAQNQRAIDAYLKIGLDALQPDVTVMWLNDPDGTAHASGIGSSLTRRSLALVDAGIGRIEDTLRAKGQLDRTNIIVTSDHGFSTHTGTFNLDALLAPFARTMTDGSRDLIAAEGAIYLRGGADGDRVAAIVAALQRRPEVGAIFTRPRPLGGRQGVVAGTLSFDVARWNHPRSGDILVSANWSNAANAAGFRGTTTQSGVAGHGSSSPFDIHNTLIAVGPDFREHSVSNVPTGNVDIAPTVLHLLGLPPAPTMTGRVVEEGLRDGPAPSSMRIERSMEAVQTADGSYQLIAHIATVAGRRYLDFTEVKRR